MYNRCHTCQLWSYPGSVFWIILYSHMIQLVLFETTLLLLATKPRSTRKLVTTTKFTTTILQLKAISLVVSLFSTMVTLYSNFPTRLHSSQHHRGWALIPTIPILRHSPNILTFVKRTPITNIPSPHQTLLSPFSKQDSIFKWIWTLQYNLGSSECFQSHQKHVQCHFIR